MTIISNGHLWKYSEFIENKNFSFDKNKILKLLSKKDIDNAYLSISNWKGYSPISLCLLAGNVNVCRFRIAEACLWTWFLDKRG